MSDVDSASSYAPSASSDVSSDAGSGYDSNDVEMTPADSASSQKEEVVRAHAVAADSEIKESAGAELAEASAGADADAETARRVGKEEATDDEYDISEDDVESPAQGRKTPVGVPQTFRTFIKQLLAKQVFNTFVEHFYMHYGKPFPDARLVFKYMNIINVNTVNRQQGQMQAATIRHIREQAELVWSKFPKEQLKAASTALGKLLRDGDPDFFTLMGDDVQKNSRTGKEMYSMHAYIKQPQRSRAMRDSTQNRRKPPIYNYAIMKVFKNRDPPTAAGTSQGGTSSGTSASSARARAKATDPVVLFLYFSTDVHEDAMPGLISTMAEMTLSELLPLDIVNNPMAEFLGWKTQEGMRAFQRQQNGAAPAQGSSGGASASTGAHREEAERKVDSHDILEDED